MVVVPMLLTDGLEVEEQIERLEVHYLANPDGDVRFAVLSDWMDAPTNSVPGDEKTLVTAKEGIARLNRRHGPAPDGGERFLLFHRRRLWNESELAWMGWERKRGKLHQLNRWLRGAADSGDVEIVRMALPGVAWERGDGGWYCSPLGAERGQMEGDVDDGRVGPRSNQCPPDPKHDGPPPHCRRTWSTCSSSIAGTCPPSAGDRPTRSARARPEGIDGAASPEELFNAFAHVPTDTLQFATNLSPGGAPRMTRTLRTVSSSGRWPGLRP